MSIAAKQAMSKRLWALGLTKQARMLDDHGKPKAQPSAVQPLGSTTPSPTQAMANRLFTMGFVEQSKALRDAIEKPSTTFTKQVVAIHPVGAWTDALLGFELRCIERVPPALTMGLTWSEEDWFEQALHHMPVRSTWITPEHPEFQRSSRQWFGIAEVPPKPTEQWRRSAESEWSEWVVVPGWLRVLMLSMTETERKAISDACVSVMACKQGGMWPQFPPPHPDLPRNDAFERLAEPFDRIVSLAVESLLPNVPSSDHFVDTLILGVIAQFEAEENRTRAQGPEDFDGEETYQAFLHYLRTSIWDVTTREGWLPEPAVDIRAILDEWWERV